MKPKVDQDGRYGFRRLNPQPSAEVLSEFYAKEYYELLERGDRFPEARRLMGGGPEADREREWLRATLYSDVLDLIKSHAPPGTVMDVGCGLGEMVEYLRENGVEAVGIEPSASVVAMAKRAGRHVEQGNLDDAVESITTTAKPGLGAVLMMNVLEHVADPVKVVANAKSLLAPGGILCARVPNDFSDLQFAAQRKLDADAWWIRTPDHINYFSWESLTAMLEGEGLRVIAAQADFPMEVFLLMGENYLTDPEVGVRCHSRRVSFELALPTAIRRRLYSSLAQAGMGRTCMVTARIP